MLRRWIILCALVGSPLVARADFTTTFENTGLAPNSSNDNAGPGGAFAIDGNKFNNSYSHDPVYGDAWSGWALSSTRNTTDPSFNNQFSSITGGGANGSSTYAVGFTYGGAAGSNSPTNPSSNPFHPSDTYISLAAGDTPESIQLTNTTYSYLAMKNGSSFNTAFAQGDYQLLDIRGYNAAGQQVGVVDFYLADYRSTNPAQWSIVNTWQTVSLAALAGATTLQFGIQSSQNDPTYGVNTPAYFAADNFTFATPAAAVPEPSSVVLVAVALGLGGVVSRRRMVA